MSIQTKTCTKCNEAKPLEAFAKRLDGLRPSCRVCVAAYRKTVEAKTREVLYAWRDRNPDKLAAVQARWYAKHKTNLSVKRAACRVQKAEQLNARQREYYVNNKHVFRANEAKYRARKLQATPLWADYDKIKAVYAEAQSYAALGLDVHVDHIVPLRGRTVCGLHVHNNLRVILAPDNLGKSNALLEEAHV